MDRSYIDALLFLYFAEEGRRFFGKSNEDVWVNAKVIPLDMDGLRWLTEFLYIDALFNETEELFSLTEIGRDVAVKALEGIYNEEH